MQTHNFRAIHHKNQLQLLTLSTNLQKIALWVSYSMES